MRKTKINGHARVAKARLRVLKKALQAGHITNEQARRVGHWNQAYYHLNKLAKAGYLKREEYNTWVPIRRRGRPVQTLSI
jgi:hypothetical protein